MRSLPLPSVTSGDVISLCLSGITDISLQARVTSISPMLIASAQDYIAGATAERLDQVPQVLSVGMVSKSELVSLYSSHLSATRGSARAVYDQLRNSAPNKKCPLCGVGIVAVLDHHLPKARYPDLSVVPANLVPACHQCNDTKKAKYPSHSGEQTLHPYFDRRLIETQWLSARIERGPPITISFYSNAPGSWPAVDRQRVQRHLDVCGLTMVFASNANDDLATLKATLEQLYERGGPEPVREYLEGERDRYSSRPNSWQLAMYDALAGDDWFFECGFENIA